MNLEKYAMKKEMVMFFEGDLPILITAPHGGTVKPIDIEAPRTKEKGYKVRDTETFSNGSEENSSELAIRLAGRLKELTGKIPYVVIANFERKYVDANRNHLLLGDDDIPHENHAYDDPNGKKYYEQYHSRIKQYVTDIRHRFKGDGLLFDLHGSSLHDRRIIVGMVNYDPQDFQRFFRRGYISVDTLLERFGFDALFHPLTGFMSLMNDQPLPGGLRTEAVPLERFQRSGLSGGFTVTTYGSNRPDGINAFQIECGLKLRTLWMNHTVEIIANAIQALYRNTLEDHYMVETLFSEKKYLGDGEGRIKSMMIEFDLKRYPRKNFPGIIFIHNRRVSGEFNTVTLNDLFLGHLLPGSPVSSFMVGGNSEIKLKHHRNELIISSSPTGNHKKELDNFEVVKANVVYCGM